MNLQNKQVEKLLLENLENIQNELIEDTDKDIESYLIPDFNKLQIEDQIVFIGYIQKHYSKYKFINNNRFQIQQQCQSQNKILQIENQKDFLKYFIKQKDWNQVIEKFKDKNFCQENKIPNFWGSDESIKAISNNKEILPIMLDLIEVHDYQQGYNYLHQILIYFKLLSYTYNDKEQNKQIIEQMIGSSLGKQILQYYEYKQILQQIKPQEFKKLMEMIQNTQLKLESNYDISLLDQYCQVCYIVQTRLIDKKYLDEYLRILFQIPEKQINFRGLDKQLLKLVFQSNKIQELYFILMFYFLHQYCSQFDFKNDFDRLEQKMTTFKEIKQKEKFLDMHCQKVMNKIDSIYQFLLSQLSCFKQQQLENQFLEELKIYQSDQQKNEQQILKLELNVLKIFSYPQKEVTSSLNLMRKFPLIIFQKIQPTNDQVQAAILFYSLLLQENQQIIFEMISSTQKLNISEITQKLLQKQFEFQQSTIYLFLLIGIVNQYPVITLQYFLNLYFQDDKFTNAEFVQNFGDLVNFIQQTPKFVIQVLDINIQKKLSNSNEEWQIVYKIFDQQELASIYEKIFEFYLNSQIDQQNKQFLYSVLQNMSKIDQKQQNPKLKPCQVLVEYLSQEDFDYLVQQIISKTTSSVPQLQLFQVFRLNLNICNCSEQITTFERVSNIIFQLLEQIKKISIQSDLLEYLNNKIGSKIFDFLKVKLLILTGKNLKFIQYSLTLKFYQTKTERVKLIEKAKSLFENDQNIYQQIFDQEKEFNIIELNPYCLKNKQKFKQLPKFSDISLEDFNISLQQISFDEKQKLISDWFSEMQNPNKFRMLIPLYFNVIKRKEHCNNLLSSLNNNNIQKQRAFNMKAMFQVLYNNSNNELQQMLLKLWSENNPIPLLFSNPDLDQVKTSQDLFSLNYQLNFIFPKCLPIINYSFSKKQNQYGKTSLINQIFYQKKKFEERDYCDLNQDTIDIMFDFCFNKTRNFAIADVHGVIPFEVMIKILPLFKLWIIQMDSEEELHENYEQFISIKQNLKQFNSECCFIIRNSKTKGKQQSQFEIEINNQGISLHKIIDLTQKGLDEQKINSEIELFQQFIFGKIKNQQSNLSNSRDFLNIVQNYYGQNNQEIKQINQDNQLLEQLQSELQVFINDPQGFYSENAFPIRSLMWQIKNHKKQQQFDGLSREQQIQQVQSINQEISQLEKKIPQSKPTRLLELFQQIFDSKNQYNLYLKLTEKLRQFNELNKIEKEKIGIEFFWRELIQIKQKGQSAQLKINPAQIIASLVKKGEPFEFLNGDQLEIDSVFLQDFRKQFSKSDKQKVLVLSVLGPQSSGKSTILNKIFGCHFLTSVGRCTQGIYLQLLKITQKDQFDNQFDYVLILDSEGLQNPNQTDPDFDKKIALFIIAISDIILINVKGDIHSKFKHLVEMCIFNLGQMKNSISTVKLLSWCFNQNSDCNNIDPFWDQIQSIVKQLNQQVQQPKNEDINSSPFDHNEVLDIKKENIKILGFAYFEEGWKLTTHTGIRQLNIVETFSEEAYIFGVQMISQFVEKLKAQQGMQLQTLSQFFQNVESHWQSICRLPDLLEFTEILQLNQDEQMKKQYELLLQQQSFDYQSQIPKIIQDLVRAENKKTLEFFKTLEKKEKQLIQKKKEQIQKEIGNELQKYKNENQIQQKIYKKYIKLLEECLQTYEYNCHIYLLDEIKKHEREFQQRKGFAQIEYEVGKISQNQQELQKYQKNKHLIVNLFTEIWTKIISSANEQNQLLFQDYSQAQYNALYSQFTQYQYISQNQQPFINFFLELSQTPPRKQNDDEKKKILSQFSQEITSQKQFQRIINNNQNMKYNIIFQQPLIDRLKKSDCNYIIDLNNYYQQQTNFFIIPLDELKKFLQSNKFYNDFKQYLINQEKQQNNNLQNKELKFNEFFNILDLCQINYNTQEFQELKKNLIQDNKWYQFNQKTQNSFCNFQNIFLQTQINNSIINQPELVRNIQHYYPSLQFEKIKLKFNNDLDFEYKRKQYSQYVLFCKKYKFFIKQQDNQEIFNFISDQKANQNLIQKFNSQILEFFPQIIQKYNGWERIYFSIYDIIQKKMIKLKNKNEDKKEETDSDQEETHSFDNYLIQQIMAQIEQKILEFNKQFANFGIILSPIGERLIYYYSMFVIWRFISYSKWKLLEENLLQLDSMKNEQLKRFTLAIEQNTTELSILNAQVLAKNIKASFLESFYSDQQNGVRQQIYSINMSCSDYIRSLDQKLLKNYQQSKQNNIQDEEILDYILDQKGYIEKSVQSQIQKKEQELKVEYECKLRKELSIFLKLILRNIEIIHNITNQQIEILRSEDYFDINDDDYKQEDYDSILFQLICQCISGIKLTNEQFKNINKEQKEIFEQNYELIKISILEKTLNDSERRIPLLKPFIQELFTIIGREFQNSQKEPLVMKSLKIQEHLNKIKSSMIGCLHSCPLCKRKCDQQSESNHTHLCSNGHQLRGMNGVLIKNQPSLNTCEEIVDSQYIATSDSTIFKKWSEMKKGYSEWKFKDLDDQKIVEVKQKMMNIWNSGIGQLVCQKLSQKLNINIQFSIKNDFNEDLPQSIHYIIIIDDSGSMEGQKWENAKNGALQCMQEIAKNGEARVSVIIFNGEARLVIDCEKVNIEKQKDLFTFISGNTCFNKAFILAYDQLMKHINKKFNKIIILFYTDGGDSYPADSVQKFCLLESNIKETIHLVSCAEGNLMQIASLVLLTDNFNKSGLFAELKPNINVKDIKKVWAEVVNQNYHKLKF